MGAGFALVALLYFLSLWLVKAAYAIRAFSVGNVSDEPIGALAHLQLGRANALEAQLSHGAEADAARAKARAAYQDFVALWKNADPNIPILKQAKAEFAALQ